VSATLKTARQQQSVSASRAAPIDEVVRALRELQSQQSLVIAAIDGRGGAGKSTLAATLREELGASVVAIDDFYRVMDETKRFELSPEAGHHQNFDWQRLQTQVLEPLRRGEPAKYDRFDWIARELGSIAEVSPGGIVVVEGIASLRPELRSFYDYAIYVETPLDVCNERLRERGDSEALISRWTAAHDWYENHCKPAADVDIVIRDETSRQSAPLK
jgi:uridine kinase